MIFQIFTSENDSFDSWYQEINRWLNLCALAMKLRLFCIKPSICYWWNSIPADTRRNFNVIITSKRRRFEVIMTLLLRYMSAGMLRRQIFDTHISGIQYLYLNELYVYLNKLHRKRKLNILTKYWSPATPGMVILRISGTPDDENFFEHFVTD